MTDIPPRCWNESEQAAVREQLERILRSTSFQQSRRRSRFLEYIIDETLAGRGDRLKGYTIACEVFDRPGTFDANIDPVVRVEAGRVRDRLREYYDGAGQGDPIRVELPKGTYTPSIEFRRTEAPPNAAEPQNADGQAHAAGAEAHAERVSGRFARAKRSPVALSAFAVFFLLIAAAGWWAVRSSAPKPVAGEAGGPADIASVPAMAVLPFTNLSGDPKEDYFSDGLTEDIQTELARSRDLRVIARNSTFQFKGQPVDVQKIGRDLKVRYVLQGSARRVGDNVRITTQLIDAKTGSHVWAEKYDREMADLLVVQDEVVNQIVGKVAGSYGAIESSEAKSALRKSPEQIQSYDLVLRAREIVQWNWTPEIFQTARNFLNKAVALDPENSRARRELAWIAVMGWVFRLDEKPVPADEIARQAAKAVELDPADARARMIAASAYFFTKQLDRFGAEAAQALDLAPYDAEIMSTLGCMISAAGDHDRGVALAEKANRINPDASIGWYNSTVYTALYLAGNYRRALEIAKQGIQDMFYVYLEIIPIYGQLGMKPDAADAWRRMQRLYPGATLQSFADWWRLWNINDDEVGRLMDGVHKSGIFEPDARTGP
ncbi:hypothetical protein [Hyphomicrobium sp.]|uniref:hypothetical protein n=1 Tax=Hyphomicrobium sp. TaxID=82 RepID=UPI000F9053F2|nr:hypothetical protein [Hyphomicrobium sp.]RUP00615.1 MAG: hypothetical protein EKK30_00705 [Hyphomicrobium sp.]